MLLGKIVIDQLLQLFVHAGKARNSDFLVVDNIK